MNPLKVLLHHSEPVDPTLAEWIRDRLDGFLGMGPMAIVIGLGAVIVLFGVIVGTLAVRRRRSLESRD